MCLIDIWSQLFMISPKKFYFKLPIISRIKKETPILNVLMRLKY